MKRRNLTRALVLVGVTLAMVVIFSEPLLKSTYRFLVYEDPLVKAEAIVVLSGGNGSRIETAARLYHEGFGEKLFFSGFQTYPGTYTSSLMKKYALKLGVPEDKIITWVPDVEVSTRGESFANLELLNKNRIQKIILVTSAIHTRRAKMTYEKSASLSEHGIEFLVYPAPDPYVPIEGWWNVRTAQKGVFLEYIKLLVYYFNV
jgi:uncharacterized SAM-binding protein YcdF (DUF218 family)